MIGPASITDFDPDFASPAEWAAMYRASGLQVIPCFSPSEVAKGGSWKRPKLSEWAEFQGGLVSETVFARWYGPAGEHSARDNMGMLTGQASGNVFVIDLDDQKGPAAADGGAAPSLSTTTVSNQKRGGRRPAEAVAKSCFEPDRTGMPPPIGRP
jgi:hypothetical protein